MSGNPYFLINRGTQARGDKEDQGNEISKKIASLISEVHCHTSESAVMNHSSILQIHLNGGENSLSGGEHSIRIFSPASASSSASSFPPLSKGLIGRGKKEAKLPLRQQVGRLKRALQSVGEPGTDL